ncbi:MAG: hypothetical protein V4515_12210 [Chloroflexota bacterium]
MTDREALAALDDALQSFSKRIGAEQDAAISRALSLRFRQGVAVSVRRPHWMPGRLYRWLMRSIVVTTTPERLAAREEPTDD